MGGFLNSGGSVQTRAIAPLGRSSTAPPEPREKTVREPSRFAARANESTPAGSDLIVLFRVWPLRTGTVRGPVHGRLPELWWQCPDACNRSSGAQLDSTTRTKGKNGPRTVPVRSARE